MKIKKRDLFIRGLFLVVILIIFFFTGVYDCLVLRFSSTSKIIMLNEGNKNVLILYGPGLCGSCPPGQKLLTYKDREDILIVLPEEFSSTDIENFRDVFIMKGKIVQGDKEITQFLKRIASCKNLAQWQNNILLDIGETGKISKIKMF